jgi:hypothetical protein
MDKYAHPFGCIHVFGCRVQLPLPHLAAVPILSTQAFQHAEELAYFSSAPRSPKRIALEAIFFEALSESVPPSPQVPNNFPTN